ncbi:tetratricopeptide repeat protein [Marinicauda sp. Alg238-R41]|uniref:tetratricopeptide repeat protein n=1 Tax=Marinicauda sp. Alg238-R41 TaxID=2993447 RepID=UPI0022E2A2B7|nr:tetratricopeptide repeat protein [Marinicauda sp. Alg238-R41]
MADVFDEVEEELRKERYTQLFRTYGPWVLGAAAAVILGVAGYQWYGANESANRATAGSQMMEAIEAYQSGDTARADAALTTLAEEGTRGYQALALMQRGALALEAGNRDEAASFFEQAARAAPDRLTRDTARYKALLIEQSELSYDDVVLRAEPLTEGTGPAGPLARELMGLAAIQAERWDEARSHYEQIAFSLDVPQNLQRRAGEALALIAQRAPAPAAEAQTPASEGEEN